MVAVSVAVRYRYERIFNGNRIDVFGLLLRALMQLHVILKRTCTCDFQR